MTTQIYARIKRTSDWAYQQRDREPFQINFDRGSDSHRHPRGYIAQGNNNDYRLADLQLFIKQGEQFVRIG